MSLGIARPDGLIQGQPSFGEVTQKVCGLVRAPRTRLWKLIFGGLILLTALFFVALARVTTRGIGVLGNNDPNFWGWPIVNFVFWIGLGHAGTLLSAILYLFRQRWRTSIHRAAEAMTLFAVVLAFIFPLMHLGRVWVAYWMFPLPNQMRLWPNFTSPLMWDVFAVSSYFLVSLLFFYVGLIPDLATLRDRSRSKRMRWIYGLGALGWHGGSRQWRSWRTAYLLLAGLATPLVLSVHSIVSFDFAGSILPGWHATIFPPYFVAGAMFSGLAMVMVIAVVLRQAFGLADYITTGHLQKMSKFLVAGSLLIAYAYGCEFFAAFYGGDVFETDVIQNRMFGPYAWAFWLMIAGNLVAPQLLWFSRIRCSAFAVFAVSLSVVLGMWLERFLIVASSLSQDFLPGSWGLFTPTFWDGALTIGALGFFGLMFFLFARFLPILSIAEIKTVLPQAMAGQDAKKPFSNPEGNHG